MRRQTTRRTREKNLDEGGFGRFRTPDSHFCGDRHERGGSGEEADTVGAAYRTYRKLQHKLRLDGMEKARVEPHAVENEREAVLRLWRRVFG